MLAGAFALSGCGLQPMYAGGSQGAVASALSGVTVPAIEGQTGWLVRNALIDRLGAERNAAPRYRLDVRLDDRLQGFGVLSNDTVTRERRTLRARYQLVDIGSGAILLDATASADAGIDVVSSEYAVIAAEQTALENLSHGVADQIITRVAVKLRQAR
jgi:LPS-assembly lipoprotein